jgi:hypothetical protein
MRRFARIQPFMAHIALAVYLLLVGLNILVDLDVPSWLLGTLPWSRAC